MADVPRRVEVDVQLQAGSDNGAVRCAFAFATLSICRSTTLRSRSKSRRPTARRSPLQAEPNEDEAGTYVAKHVPREPGAYRAAIKVAAPDGSPVGEREAGWVAQPVADEFNRLRPNRARCSNEIAAKTGGEVIASNDLERIS